MSTHTSRARYTRPKRGSPWPATRTPFAHPTSRSCGASACRTPNPQASPTSPPISSSRCCRPAIGPARSSPRSPTGSPPARGSCGLSILLVVPPHPVEPLAPLVPPLGHQIEVVVRRVEQVDAARVGRVGVKHPARRILVEDAYPFPLG